MSISKLKVLFSNESKNSLYRVIDAIKLADINIIYMEASTKCIYFKLFSKEKNNLTKLNYTLLAIHGIEEVTQVEILKWEKLEIIEEALLNYSPHGLIFLNRKGEVEKFNGYIAKNFPKVKTGDCIFLLNPFKNIRRIIEDGKRLVGNKLFVFDGNSYYYRIDNIISREKTLLGYLVSVFYVESNVSDVDKVTFEDIIGKSKNIMDAKERAILFSTTTANILLLGESGTGKELFARAIHNTSRPGKGFTAVNCAAIPEDLLESELFGYAPGSFTGGLSKGKMGIFEACSGGTVFLDEVCELSNRLQAKLLRAIQEKSIRRLGSNEEINLDIRIISATNKNLVKLVKEGKFRLDLFYRLNTLYIELPPLRERVCDIGILAESILLRFAQKYQKGSIGISRSCLDMLEKYNWPGNIRELENVLERAYILADKERIYPKDIILDKQGPCYGDYKAISLEEAVAIFERKYILDALNGARSIREAARNLSTTHTLLLNRMKKYSIKKDGQVYK